MKSLLLLFLALTPTLPFLLAPSPENHATVYLGAKRKPFKSNPVSRSIVEYCGALYRPEGALPPTFMSAAADLRTHTCGPFVHTCVLPLCSPSCV